MGEDAFEKGQRLLAEETVKAGAVALATGQVGVAAGVLAAGVGGAALAWLRDHASSDARDLADARYVLLEEQCAKLDARVAALETREGPPPERLDPIAENAVYSDFVRAVSTAATETKREALVIAACRQHDPEAGSLAVRRYWWDLVKSLSDIQIEAVRMLGTSTIAAAQDRDGFVRAPSYQSLAQALQHKPSGLEHLPRVPDEFYGLVVTLHELRDGKPQLVLSRELREHTTEMYELNHAGRVLLKFVQD